MAVRESERLKVFISYSRRDSPAADALTDALKARGIEVAIDRRDLPFGEKWQSELAELIRLSDTVIWLVSEASINSKWVNWELDEVARRNKRLVPVMVADTDRGTLPRQLGEIHILPAQGVFDLTRDLDVLVQVLETDRAWLKQASRLQDRATEWLSNGRAPSLLLSRGALADAEKWKDGRPPKAPAPAQEVLELLLASRQAATRRQRWWVGGATAVALGAVALAAIAYLQRLEAQRNFETAKQSADALVVDIARGLRDVEGMQIESVRKILTRAETAFGKLSAAAPDDPGLLQSRVAMLNEFVETYLDKGDAAEAHKAAVASVAAAERLVARRGNDGASRRQLALALLKLGDAKRELGENAEAGTAYARGLEIRRALASEAPEDAVARREVAVALARLGSLAEGEGDFKSAKDFYSESLALRLELAKLRAAWRRDVVVAYIVLGDSLLELGDLAEAGANFEKAVALAAQLHQAEPTNTKIFRDLAVGQQRQGNHAIKLKDAARARSFYEASRATFERLSRINPDNMEWRRDIAVSDGKLAKAAELAGDRTRALELHREAVGQWRGLLDKSPENSQLQIDLAEALKNQAALLPASEARPVLIEARNMLRALARRNALGREQKNWLAAIETQVGPGN